MPPTRCGLPARKRSGRRRSLCGLATIYFALLTAVPDSFPAAGGEWKGTRVVKDGVVHVMNPAEPMEPAQVYDLQPIWSLQSEAEEGVVFGTIDRVEVDSAGSLYVLDRTLSMIHVVSADGRYVRAVSRQGDGPGEFRSPADFYLEDDCIVVADSHPPKLMRFGGDGLLKSEWRPSLPEGIQAAAMRVFPVAPAVALSLQLQEWSGTIARYKMLLGLFCSDGESGVVLFDRSWERESGSPPSFDEARSEPLYFMSVDSKGNMFLSPDYGTYSIHKFTPGGALRTVIERECEQHPRTASQISEMRTYYEERYQRWPGAKISVEEAHRCIQDLHHSLGDSLWVETARGWYNNDAGVACVLDVLDTEGRFIHQRVYRAAIDAWEDSMFFLGTRVLVAHMGGSAQSGGSNGGAEAPSGDAASVPEIVLYRASRIE